MDSSSTIIITGAAGFIGSCLVGFLNDKGYEDLILVDEFENEEKDLNLLHKKYTVRVERENFFECIGKEKPTQIPLKSVTESPSSGSTFSSKEENGLYWRPTANWQNNSGIAISESIQR